MVINSKGREGRGEWEGKHTWIWIYNGSQQADWVLSSTKMSPAGNGTKNRIEPQPHQRHMRWPQLINSLNASVERRRQKESQKGKEWERESKPESTRDTRLGPDLTVQKDMPMKFNTFSSFFFLWGMLHCMRCLSPSLSLFFSCSPSRSRSFSVVAIIDVA